MVNLVNSLMYLVILVYILYRQLRTREVKVEARSYVIILLIGVYLFGHALANKQVVLTGQTIGILAIIFIFLAVGLGAVRGLSCKLWKEGTVFYRKGTILTLTLWAFTVGAHIFLDRFIDGGQYSTLLYLGLSLYTQHRVVLQRTKLSPAIED